MDSAVVAVAVAADGVAIGAAMTAAAVISVAAAEAVGDLIGAEDLTAADGVRIAGAAEGTVGATSSGMRESGARRR